MSTQSLTIVGGPSADALERAYRVRTQDERVSFSVLIPGGQRVQVELELSTLTQTTCCGPNYKVEGRTPEHVRLLPEHDKIVIPLYDSHTKTGIMEFR